MPQNAYNKTIGVSRNSGPALLMDKADHALTRTFRGAGAKTMITDAGLNTRQRMAQEILDIRKNFGGKYNQGLREMLDYAKTIPGYLSK